MAGESMMEITFRLPTEELGALLRALGGQGWTEGGRTAAGENPAFDRERFARMAAETAPSGGEEAFFPAGEAGYGAAPSSAGRAAGETAPARRVRAEVGRRLSVPEPASYGVELPAAAPAEGRGLPVPEEKTGEKWEERRLERRWERDSRRYDGGFSLY